MSTEQEYIDSRALARLLAVSVKFIEKHRTNIVGARKIGGLWRFCLAEIRACLATGRDVIIK